MSNTFAIAISEELKIRTDQVESTVKLLVEGSTIPFISRYRKEATGSLDEVQITNIRDRWQQMVELEKRRATILETIKSQGKLTDVLAASIRQAQTISVLEDIYLPYRPKRRTKATVAKEKGLEPLAAKIYEQSDFSLEDEAMNYLSEDKGVMSIQDALDGARDIIAEWINEDADVRSKLRHCFLESGIISSKVVRGKQEEGQKYQDYFEWQQIAKTAPSHRILATRRGEKEEILMLKIEPPPEEALAILENVCVTNTTAASREVSLAVKDSYKRLLAPSLETEIRMELKNRADRDAIAVFQDNLQELLMAPPLGSKRIMAIDPGMRTGSKIVCLDEHGKLLTNDTVYLFGSAQEKSQALVKLKKLTDQYQTEIIAIGNGTGSRETEAFCRQLTFDKPVPIILVNESGASIYSASEIAREEFPDHDVTVRGAISIGRRLMDPLAELVKIDAKSIGVGQYQHDVDQNLLKQCLDDTVVSCVNKIGVEVNFASQPLLMYVSGLGPALAKSIVHHRETKGPFKNRLELKNVSGLGEKAFEQCAGFLRITDGDHPLDQSSVHPESYPIVQRILDDLGCDIKTLMTDKNMQKQIDLKKYVTDEIGLPTLRDIKAEIEKPGRDPREAFELFAYKDGIETIDDLTVGMKLPGVVTNVTAFGAFVDVGVHQDGLVHISQLADKFVSNPSDVVKVHQKVQVTVMEVDSKRNRIALSMRKNPK